MKIYKTLLISITLFLLILVSGSKLEESQADSVKFYSPENGVYVVDVDTSKCQNCLEPYVSDSLETVEQVAEKTNALVAINAGFFDPSNTMTTSYVVKDSQVVADPTLNPDLMQNPGLKEYLPAILNRSEFRILDCVLNTGRSLRMYNINRHNYSEGKCVITHSIQAGPELVPELKLSEEAFVVRSNGKVVKQSAGALGKYARSAIGIKGDHILLVAVSNENPVTIAKLSKLMRSLNVDKAMAFDGGSSTSLYVKLPGSKKFVLNSAKDNAARRVKSILLIKNAQYFCPDN